MAFGPVWWWGPSAITLINVVGDYYSTPGRRYMSIKASHFTEIRLFVHQLARAYNKENIKAPLYCSFVRGITLWRVWLGDSHYKGPAMRKVFPWHDVVMRNDNLLKHFLYFTHWCLDLLFWLTARNRRFDSFCRHSQHGGFGSRLVQGHHHDQRCLFPSDTPIVNKM